MTRTHQPWKPPLHLPEPVTFWLSLPVQPNIGPFNTSDEAHQWERLHGVYGIVLETTQLDVRRNASLGGRP